MCDCKKEMEEKLLESVKQQKPNAQQLKVEIAGYGIMIIGNTMVLRPVMPVSVEYVYNLKNGKQKAKKETISFALKHCPFCGEEIARQAA